MTTAELRTLLGEVLGVSVDQIHGGLAFGEFSKWDSIAHIELMVVLEERLGIEIAAEQIVELTTVPALESFVAAYDVSLTSREPDHAS
jgi:acyl carrier protein